MQKKAPWVIYKWNVHFWIMFNFWWLAKQSERRMFTEMQKNEKRPPKSSKNEMFVSGLCSTSDDWPSNLSDEHQLKCKKMKKGPLRHRKIKCLFLDQVQLLMISWAIWSPPAEKNWFLKSTFLTSPPPKQKNFDFLKVHFWLDQSMPP